VNRSKWILAAIAAFAAHSATAAASFTIINMDGPGEGLNDPTPFTPEGGNNATTLGAARMAVLEEAGRVWGLQLNSTIPIVVEAWFDPLTCSPMSGTLGYAGALSYYSDPSFPNPAAVYPVALADVLAGENINGDRDIETTLNSSVGNAGCLDTGSTMWPVATSTCWIPCCMSSGTAWVSPPTCSRTAPPHSTAANCLCLPSSCTPNPWVSSFRP
jgi:hypothetical protein